MVASTTITFPSLYERYVDPFNVTFDGENKLILVNDGVTDLDWGVDVYSTWKRWAQERDNAKFLPAMRSVGGDPKPGGALGATYFLMNGWRLRTWSGDHRLSINGNVYTEEGNPITVPAIGNYNIELVLNLSAEVYAADPDLVALRDAFWALDRDDAGAVANSIGEYVRKTLLDKFLYLGTK